jgi:hypothetical protein
MGAELSRGVCQAHGSALTEGLADGDAIVPVHQQERFNCYSMCEPLCCPPQYLEDVSGDDNNKFRARVPTSYDPQAISVAMKGQSGTPGKHATAVPLGPLRRVSVSF